MFAKLKDLDTISINEAKPLVYVKWNGTTMERSPSPSPGYRADYAVTLDNGDTLSLTEAQLGKILVASYMDGKANVVGNTYNVTHNVVTKRFPDGEKEVDFPEFEMVKGPQSSEEDFPL